MRIIEKMRVAILLLMLTLTSGLYAQDLYGPPIFIPVSPDNDTIGMVTLNPVVIAAGDVAHDADYFRTRRLRYNIYKVMPYARQALKVMAEVEDSTAVLDRRRAQKRYKKDLENDLKDKFKDDLKNLSKSQGKVLIKILERETGRTFYDILKELKRPVYAFKWQALSKLYGYDLKEGYDPKVYSEIEQILLSIEARQKLFR